MNILLKYLNFMLFESFLDNCFNSVWELQQNIAKGWQNIYWIMHSYCMQNKSPVLSLLEEQLMRKTSEEYFIP